MGLALLLVSMVRDPIPSGLVLASTKNRLPPPVVQERIGLPVRLKIPELKVNADVESIGLTPQGSMDVPKDETNVAWFNLGQRPGEIGSAVIAGHYGLKNGKPTVFNKLHTLGPGDKVYVEDENGTSVAFVVRETKRYDPNADAPEVFGSSDGLAHLNLVTCEGVWNKTLQSYSNRLVVFSDAK